MKLCDVLGISDKKVLIPKTKTIKKLTTYIPRDDAADLKNKLFGIGAGSIGKYDNCSFLLKVKEHLKVMKVQIQLLAIN